MALHRGAVAKALKITSIRPLTREDLGEITKHRGSAVSLVTKLRDAHHRVARLLASGLRDGEVSLATGYSLGRIYQLKQDPTMKDLIAKYRDIVDEAFVDSQTEHYETLTRVKMKSARMLEEHLDKADEDDELIPINRLVSIFDTVSDRVGITKRSTNLNVNVDFAAKLEAAIARSEKVLEASPAPKQPATDAAIVTRRL